MIPVPPAADAGMLFLAVLRLGMEYRAEDGKMFVHVPGAGPQPVTDAVLDKLEADGLLDLSGADPQPTDRGTYVLKKWADRHWKHCYRGGG